MSLIKKFQILFNNETRNQNRVDESVKIAEGFAIEFHTWHSSIIDRIGILEYKKRFMNKTTQQLLEIFKQEKEIEQTNSLYSKSKVFSEDTNSSAQEMLDRLIVKYNSFELEQLDDVSILALKAIKEKIEYIFNHYPDVKQTIPIKEFNLDNK